MKEPGQKTPRASVIIALFGVFLALTVMGQYAEAQNIQYFPQLADGGGYVTTWYFTSLGAGASTVTLDLFHPNGAPLALQTNRGTGSSFTFDVPASGELSIRTIGAPAAVQAGWARVTSNASVGTTEVFQNLVNGQSVSQAGVLPSDPTIAATLFIAADGRSRNTGLAVANVGNIATSVGLTLYNQAGSIVATSSINLEPHAQIARFIDQLAGFAGVGAIEGTLALSAQSPVSIVTLLLDGLQLSTLPTLPPRIFGSNLIVNANAEQGLGSSTGAVVPVVPGWTTSGGFTVVTYGGDAGFPSPGDAGPVNRGNNFFAGGPTSSSTASQVINLASVASVADASRLTFNLSGYLGGFANQSDNAALIARFRDVSGSILKEVSIGPVSAADRQNATGLLLRETAGPVPPGTRDVVVVLNMTQTSGYNDGYADNLSLVLTALP